MRGQRGPSPVNGDRVDLYWIPLGAGAGGALVRLSGRTYEAMVAAREAPGAVRSVPLRACSRVDGVTTTIEMAPVWVQRGERGVVAEGPWARGSSGTPASSATRCGAGAAARSPTPRPPAAVRNQWRTTAPPARRLLGLVAEFPVCTWGRDELYVGEMWNSNSLVSWLLARAGLWTSDLGPPRGGRAPGWDAGLRAASQPDAPVTRRRRFT